MFGYRWERTVAMKKRNLSFDNKKMADSGLNQFGAGGLNSKRCVKVTASFLSPFLRLLYVAVAAIGRQQIAALSPKISTRGAMWRKCGI